MLVRVSGGIANDRDVIARSKRVAIPAQPPEDPQRTGFNSPVYDLTVAVLRIDVNVYVRISEFVLGHDSLDCYFILQIEYGAAVVVGTGG